MTEHPAPVDAAVAALFDGHAAACSLLSALLLQSPDAELASRLQEADPLRNWPLSTPDPDRDEGLQLLVSWSASALADRSADDAVAEAAAAHMRLFRGPGPAQACPYESVHRDEERLTFGEHTVAVRHWYARHGVSAPRPNVEPDDHIGLELAFVCHLCLIGLAACEAGDAGRVSSLTEELRGFLEEHLLVWADLFTTDLIEHADNDLYRATGLLLRSTCRSLRSTFC